MDGNVSVLVIEDDPLARGIIDAHLQEFGYTVVLAEDGKSGLAAVESNSIDIALLDYMMPDMDGLTTLSAMLKIRPDLPVIMLTAMGTVDLGVNFIKNGGADFITKPIEHFEILDIRLRKTLENSVLKKKLARSEAHSRAIVETVANGIITIDESGIVQVFNPAAEEIFGYLASEIIGKNVLVLMPSSIGKHHEGYISDYLCGLKEPKLIGKRRELTGRRKDGSEIPLVVRIAEMHVGVNRIFVGAMSDLTETKKAEKILIKAIADRTSAEQASESKSQFLATGSHEMRTPLTAILGFAEILRDESSCLDPKQRNYIDRIISNANHQVSVINDVLDIAKIEAGKMVYVFMPHRLSAIVDGVCNSLQSLADAHGNKIIVTDSSPDGSIINCDEVRMSQVIRNLLGNAIKYSNKNTEIIVNIESDDALTTFLITDEGLDIPENELSKIFESFTQSSRTDDGSGGTGLGLTLCKIIIQDHGGNVWAENREDGNGATFKFEIPK